MLSREEGESRGEEEESVRERREEAEGAEPQVQQQRLATTESEPPASVKLVL